jgi:adenylate cyclase
MTTRRLAVIMAADIVGFSAMMERDEDGTHARVKEFRREVIEPRIGEHKGRMVKTMGDGFIVEFARCGRGIQSEIGQWRFGSKPEAKLKRVTRK